VTALDTKLRHFDIKTGDWQELMSASLQHAKHTEEDLVRQSKRAAEVKQKVKKILSSPGPAGQRGPLGQPGPMGADGGMGDVGERGPAGNEGDPGVRGSAGPIGAVGRDGFPGKPGMRGKPGRAGIAGATGYQGETGKTGPRGKQGHAGDPGLIGPAGMNVVGIAGNQGVPGPRGEMGLQGPPGPEGSEGLQGNIGIRGKWGFPGMQGIYGEVQGQIWDPLTWNYAGPESPRTVGRRDGGGGWSEYAGSPSFNARRGPRGKLLANKATMLAKAEGTPSLYPSDKPKVVGLRHRRLSDEEWWEKHEAAAKEALKNGPRRVGCEGSESVDDLTNDSLYVACNSMGKGAAIEMNNMGSKMLKRVASAPRLDGQDTDSPREMVVKGGKVVAGDDFSGAVKDIANVLRHEHRGARAVKSALKRFRSISIRDDDYFGNPKVVDLDRNGNPVHDSRI